MQYLFFPETNSAILQQKAAAHRVARLRRGASVPEKLDGKEEKRERGVNHSRMNIQTYLSETDVAR